MSQLILILGLLVWLFRINKIASRVGSLALSWPLLFTWLTIILPYPIPSSSAVVCQPYGASSLFSLAQVRARLLNEWKRRHGT